MRLNLLVKCYFPCLFITFLKYYRLKIFLKHQKIYEQNNQTTDGGARCNKKVGRVETVSLIHSEHSSVRIRQSSMFLAIIIQVIFSHKMLCEVERAYY